MKCQRGKTGVVEIHIGLSSFSCIVYCMSGDVEKDFEELYGDASIGANVAILRGDRTQKVIADAMKKLGFKWTQTTVWEVESGKRSLKAKEARALAEVLGTYVQNLYNETAVTQSRQVVYNRVSALQKLEIEAAEAIEKYALGRSKGLELAEEVMFELEHSGVDHDAVLWSMAETLKRLATKSLQDVLDERAEAIRKTKESFGEGATLRFYPGAKEVVRNDENSPRTLADMMTEEEANGIEF